MKGIPAALIISSISPQITWNSHNVHPQHISVKRQLRQKHKCLSDIFNIHHGFNLVTSIGLESAFA